MDVTKLFVLFGIPAICIWLVILWIFDFINAVRRDGLWKVLSVKRIFIAAGVLLSCSAFIGLLYLAGAAAGVSGGGGSPGSWESNQALGDVCVLLFWLSAATAFLALIKYGIEGERKDRR